MEDQSALTSMVTEDKEVTYGITEFFDTGNIKGFDGQLKTRISDFLVNEVDLDGNILHLTQLTVSSELYKEDPVADETLDPSIKEKINRFLASGEKSIQIPAPDNKEERRNLHKQIEAHFPNDRLLRDPQQTSDGRRVIEISRGSTQSQQMRRQEATRNRRSVNDYIHFSMYKENMDTAEAVSIIGGFLRVPPKSIQFAGTKDKRARTVQRVSIKHRDPDRLAKFSRTALRIGNFAFEKEPLSLGDLGGNHFQLAMRGITAEVDVVENAARKFSEGGFINYFGLQRFGTTEISTVEVGKALLKSQWDNVVELIMRPRSGDNDVLAKCRKIWVETGEADKALRVLGRRHCIEADLLQGLLKNHEKDLFGAIQRIPRNSRLIYVHSYQSLLWNKAASFRLRTLGRKPVTGDLVFETVSRDCRKRLKKEPFTAEKVVVLTADTVDQYSIYDVVLPLPGYDVQFPETSVTNFLIDSMLADGIDLRERHKIKDYSLSGSYRLIATKPKNISWCLKRFEDPNQDLLLSDLDILEQRKLPATCDTGPHTALIINFTLPSSVYATMAIRELTRRSSNSRIYVKNASSLQSAESTVAELSASQDLEDVDLSNLNSELMDSPVVA